MPLFRYSARNQQTIVSGEVQAADCTAAATLLLAQHMEPLTIDPLPKNSPWFRHLPLWHFKTGPGVDEQIVFSRQMFTLIHAGVPLIHAFQSVREYAHHIVLKETLDNVIEALQSGRDLASALAAYPHVFGRLLPRLVRVGEQTGRLEEAFRQMSHYLERDQALRRRIQTALRYPLFVLCATLLALFVVNYFVVPAFAGLFAKFGAELPLMTRLLLATSQFTQTFWPLLLLGIAGSYYAFSTLIQTPKGGDWWDKKKLHLPLVGTIIHHAYLARLARTFAMGTQSGLTVAHTLSMVGETLENRFMAQKLAKMNERVERGEPITQAAYHSGLFPPMVLQMLAVGDQTGNMGGVLTEVADFYDREVAYHIEKLSASVEPILIFIVAIFVFILALGIFLPLWNLGSVALGRR